MGEGQKKRHYPSKHGSSYRTYIFKVAIVLRDVVVEVTRQHVHVLGAERLRWNVTRSVRMPGVWVMMSEGGTLRFVLDSGVEVDVRRWTHPAANRLGTDFLNVEVENEQRLSKETDGLLGKFSAQGLAQGLVSIILPIAVDRT